MGGGIIFIPTAVKNNSAEVGIYRTEEEEIPHPDRPVTSRIYCPEDVKHTNKNYTNNAYEAKYITIAFHSI